MPRPTFDTLGQAADDEHALGPGNEFVGRYSALSRLLAGLAALDFPPGLAHRALR